VRGRLEKSHFRTETGHLVHYFWKACILTLHTHLTKELDRLCETDLIPFKGIFLHEACQKVTVIMQKAFGTFRYTTMDLVADCKPQTNEACNFYIRNVVFRSH